MLNVIVLLIYTKYHVIHQTFLHALDWSKPNTPSD